MRATARRLDDDRAATLGLDDLGPGQRIPLAGCTAGFVVDPPARVGAAGGDGDGDRLGPELAGEAGNAIRIVESRPLDDDPRGTGGEQLADLGRGRQVRPEGEWYRESGGDALG